MKRLFTSLAAVLALAASASACDNDSELPRHEREFRSSYKRFEAPDNAYERDWMPTAAIAPTLMAVAGLSAIGAIWFTSRQPKKPS